MRKCINNIPTSPISIKNKKHARETIKKTHKINKSEASYNIGNIEHIENTSNKENREEIVTRSKKKSKKLTFSDKDNSIIQSNSITSSLSTEELSNDDENGFKMKQTTILGKQLKSMWTNEKIDIIINLFKELELDKENKKILFIFYNKFSSYCGKKSNRFTI